MAAISLVKDSRDAIMRVLLTAERERSPRAERHTALPGGSGIGSAGTMTGPRGASLDWDSARRGNARRAQVAGNTALS
jgi:hypothetical protein